MALHRPMIARDPDEEHRASTPLELLFDLTFVVAIAQAAASLHHGIGAGHFENSLVAFPMVFFAIWWAWMNFTWFASAFDTEDVLYRCAVFVQIVGALIIAAGIPRAFERNDLVVVVVGYIVMRIALVSQWLRAARADGASRMIGTRYAVGIAICQVGWIANLVVPHDARRIGFVVLALCELAVPMWAERKAVTAWHPGHIAERYGLFTIIVLGESVLSATIAVQQALDSGDSVEGLAPIVVGGLLIVFSLWWISFDQPAEAVVHHARAHVDDHDATAFIWGYGHYLVFAGAAATGAGLAVAVDHVVATSGSLGSATPVHAVLTDRQAGLAVALPVALFVLSVWALHVRHDDGGRLQKSLLPVASALVLLGVATGQAALTAGLVLASVVATKVVIDHRRQPSGQVHASAG